MFQTYELVALIGCLVASAFYSASEAVLLSISIDRARQIIKLGGAKGKALSFIAERHNEILTLILIGNTLVNILAASLTTTVAARFFHSEVIGISVAVSTIMILLFGEIIPKTFARSRAEALSVFVIRVLQINFYLLYPIIAMVTWFIETILGEHSQLYGRIVTKNDIEYMVDRAEKEKTIDSKQLNLLNSILEFPTIKVKDIMVPRAKVKFIDRAMPFKQIVELVRDDNHSRYPVCKGSLDNTIGFLHVKDLAFVNMNDPEKFEIKKLLKKPFFVYEHMKIQAVFDHMNRKKVHLALIKDENGLIVGIVTLEDIMEEIFGEIMDEHDEEESIDDQDDEESAKNGILVDGLIPLRNLDNEYDIKIPLNDNFSTLAGFLLDMLGNNFPEVGQIIVWEGLSFEIMNVANYEIKEVRIRDVDGEKHFFSKIEAKHSFSVETAEKKEDSKEISDKNSTGQNQSKN